jgi:hypothetical protein
VVLTRGRCGGRRGRSGLDSCPIAGIGYLAFLRRAGPAAISGLIDRPPALAAEVPVGSGGA